LFDDPNDEEVDVILNARTTDNNLTSKKIVAPIVKLILMKTSMLKVLTWLNHDYYSVPTVSFGNATFVDNASVAISLAVIVDGVVYRMYGWQCPSTIALGVLFLMKMMQFLTIIRVVKRWATHLVAASAINSSGNKVDVSEISLAALVVDVLKKVIQYNS
jgi:hypothetical protein